jgi:hypothetical protein
MRELTTAAAQRCFDPAGSLAGDGALLAFFEDVARAALRRLRAYATGDGHNGTLEERWAALPQTAARSTAAGGGPALPLVSLPLEALGPWLAGLRPLRAACSALRAAVPWSPLPTPARSRLRHWELADAGPCDPQVTAAAQARLRAVLFDHLPLRSLAYAKTPALDAALRTLLLSLDAPCQDEADPYVQLAAALPALRQGWAVAWERGGGALVVYCDDRSAASVSELRRAAASLRCVGRSAEVLGPFHYPYRRSAPAALRCFLGGCELRDGEIWALRAALV